MTTKRRRSRSRCARSTRSCARAVVVRSPPPTTRPSGSPPRSSSAASRASPSYRAATALQPDGARVRADAAAGGCAAWDRGAALLRTREGLPDRQVPGGRVRCRRAPRAEGARAYLEERGDAMLARARRDRRRARRRRRRRRARLAAHPADGRRTDRQRDHDRAAGRGCWSRCALELSAAEISSSPTRRVSRARHPREMNSSDSSSGSRTASRWRPARPEPPAARDASATSSIASPRSRAGSTLTHPQAGRALRLARRRPRSATSSARGGGGSRRPRRTPPRATAPAARSRAPR